MIAVLGALVVLLVVGGSVGGVLLLRQPSRHEPKPPAAPRPAPATVTVTTTPTPDSSPSPAGVDFPDLYTRVSSGVVRIETTACAGGGVGSGFLIAPDMVATVAHVVNGAAAIAIRSGHITTTGSVVGYDPGRELALVQTARPLPGHVFTLDSSQPPVGVDVGAIGYPLGGDESLSKGAISGLQRRIDVEGHHLAGMIQTDAALNPGNSGGPLLTADGVVVGLVEAKRTDAENIGYAIPSTSAASQLSDWRHYPQPVRWTTGCDAPTGPDGLRVDIADRSGSADGPSIARALSSYVEGINSGDYAEAYHVLSPAERQKVPFDSFRSGDLTSYIVDLGMDSVTAGDGVDTVEVRFTSVQDPTYGYHGQSCSHWSMTYTMVRSGPIWLIDKAVPHPGSPTPC